MGEETKTVVDTYAIIADLTGQATRRAVEILDGIRLGGIEGMLHYIIVYELAYHWRRERLPFRDEEELLEFIDTYFTVKPLDASIALEAVRVKIIGDKLLVASKNPSPPTEKTFSSRCNNNSSSYREKAPIVTGDAVLSYVVRKLGTKILW